VIENHTRATIQKKRGTLQHTDDMVLEQSNSFTDILH
jgi:hypothetical protein